MMDAFVRVDMNGFIQECNDTFGKMLGYDTEELRKFRYMDLTQEKWNSYVEEIVQNQIVPRGYSDVYEKEYRRKDGTIVPIEMRVSLITDNKNQPSGMWAIVRDITERKRAEEALQKAKDELEQRVRERTAELAKANEDLDIFRKFVEASNQGFSMADLDNHLTYLNPALCHMLGEEGPDNALGKHLSIYYSEESNRRGQEEIEPALMRAGYWQGELPMLSRQGKSIPTWQNAFVIRDRQGSPLRFAVVITDMTERKQAEATLRQSHDELRAIYDGMVDGMLVVDIETKRFFTANAAMARMLGYSETELRSLAVKDIHPPADLPFVVEQFQGLAEGRIEVSEDVPVLRKDGSVFYAMVTSSKVTYDDRPCIVGFFRDVTERRRAEEALRQSEERYELAVRGAGVGIWDWDIRTGKVYYSARWKMLFGYDENDIGGSVDDWATLLHPDERDWILKFQEDFLAGPLSTVSVEYRLRHKDGSYRWIVAHGLAVRDEQGRAYRFVGSHGDITDRKHAEEALAKERQSLWRMLQASDHERQIISYEIHDGLAQYLAAARMQFQAYDSLKENLPNEAAKAYDTAVELVRQAYAESRRLINEVRPPVIDEIGLETAISHLVHEQRKRGGPKIECQSNVQFGKLPSILENALYRIAQEALTNACKHSKSKQVMVTLAQVGHEVRLEVRDWGIGFNPASPENGRFGLEGIRQRVRLLGGRLTIESKPDSGTMVQVFVPIVARPGDQ
jgi:PAS domain S-box-containing protein